MAERQHLRVDTFKLFDEDDANLQFVMTKIKTKNKSLAYREALNTYRKFSSAIDALAGIESLKAAQQNHDEKLENLYFIVQGAFTAIKELTSQVQALQKNNHGV